MLDRKAQGTIVVDGNEVGQTLKCPHCQAIFEVVRGSGRRRGFCMNCMAPTCGDKKCCECLPWEKRFEEFESGKRKFLFDPE